ncbi:MAG TPA: bifunctional (p)ppGpp synthetase/guanosine-3',5'-bis(diphosphate) 3'-pyrophosphohydrolase [Thermotogota bacterium]|nr:bifunctional (p)ppGpp synthetase/guanosine-3',5'-bis(diphosphate) 3'-pyrophosphohydrolase [Thermotogota bacterium]HPJ89105.1 bifunctional (p)ppGpp synthetase/guanosine-3',5'-bis(diphosphate) 3'-pyrophosphohydrolase [Thermotogota bacterium]
MMRDRELENSGIKMSSLPSEMREIMNTLNKNYELEDLQGVYDAYLFARNCHAAQVRKSGEPFIIHPVNVALILARLRLDVVTVKAALLHDVVEDTDVTLDQIREKFGTEVALIVDGVTKIDKIELSKSNLDKKAETILKMFFAMTKDIRVILVKLADRLHNMRTLDSMKPYKQKEKAAETLQIFAPIAHRLGIHAIKWELEDLAFKYLYPEEYERTLELVDSKRATIEILTAEFKASLLSELITNGVDCEIKGREKHLYSVWQKMKKKGKTIDDMYDLIALRIITKTESDCYVALGIVHKYWNPIMSRLKDYIATPKSNGYRSIHTTMMTHQGKILEVQIRSRDMDEEAEYGLAAHWAYKSNKKNIIRQQKWLKSLAEWYKDYEQGLTRLTDFQNELMEEDEVYVYTPRGEVKHLPLGSTPIDFAYSIHTEIGHHFAGARVNDEIVQMDYILKNGDKVEIITNKNRKNPSLDWIKFAKSSGTRAKIRSFFKKQNRDDLIEEGRNIIRKVAKRVDLSMEKVVASEVFQDLIGDTTNFTEEDIFMKIGDSKYTYEQISALFEKEEEEEELVITSEKQVKSNNIVFVNGESGISVRIARCCNPIPGDRVIGITSKKGITVHKLSCPNAKNVTEGDTVQIQWGDNTNELYLTKIYLESSDTSGQVVKDIVQKTREKSIKIIEVNTRFDEADYVIYTITVQVKDRKQLYDVMGYWKGLKGITRVYRTKGG